MVILQVNIEEQPTINGDAKHTPVIFHNLAGYDLFIKNIGLIKGKVDCIPTNEDKYISFKKQIMVDSFIKKEKKLVI